MQRPVHKRTYRDNGHKADNTHTHTHTLRGVLRNRTLSLMSVTNTQCTHKHSDTRETARVWCLLKTRSCGHHPAWVCPCPPHVSSASVASAVDSGRFPGFLRDGDDWVRVGFLLQTLDGHIITGDFFADHSDDWCSLVLCPLLCVFVLVSLGVVAGSQPASQLLMEGVSSLERGRCLLYRTCAGR